MKGRDTKPRAASITFTLCGFLLPVYEVRRTGAISLEGKCRTLEKSPAKKRPAGIYRRD
jgi:hypothetical protein